MATKDLAPRLQALRAHLQAVAGDPSSNHAFAQSFLAQTYEDSVSDLAKRFDLDRFEESVVALVLAQAVDTRLSHLVMEVKQNAARAAVDVALAIDLFSTSFEEGLDAQSKFVPNSRLIAGQLLRLDAPTSQTRPLETRLRLPARVLNQLLGTSDAYFDGFSRLVSRNVSLDDVVLPQKTKEAILRVVGNQETITAARRSWLGDAPSTLAKEGCGDGLTFLIQGVPGTGKTLLSHAIATHMKSPILLVDTHRLQRERSLEQGLNTLVREAKLHNAVLLFDDCELIFSNRLSGNRDLPLLLAALDRFEGTSILITNLPQQLDPALDRRVTIEVSLEVPPPSLREQIWKLHMPKDAPLSDDVDLRTLAEKFEFAGGYVRNAVTVAVNTAITRSPENPLIQMTDLEDASRAQVRHRLKQLADRAGTHLTLDDVILPTDVKDQLMAILAAVRNRRVIFDEWGFGAKLTTGRGLCALLRGDSGTGKTLAAEIIANELAMPLYRVRIPAIVSKYVGETEKNLEKCFHEAGLAGALLLFDEADSIFSKRVEVSSSNDRHSNMEVNLLLQEVERFEGVVILTTNLDAAIDDAFDRRLNFKVDFPFPDAEARSAIWRHLLPDEAPMADDVNYEYLGEDFDLSGGCIKNAVIRAAYTAAEQKGSIDMKLLEEAAEQEYRELGKLVPIRRNPWD